MVENDALEMSVMRERERRGFNLFALVCWLGLEVAIVALACRRGRIKQ